MPENILFASKSDRCPPVYTLNDSHCNEPNNRFSPYFSELQTLFNKAILMRWGFYIGYYLNLLESAKIAGSTYYFAHMCINTAQGV